MDETPKDEEGWRQWAAAEVERARLEAEQAVRQGDEQVAWWRRQAAGQEQEFLRQTNLMYGGLIGIAAVMIQAFLTAPSLDLSAKICVVAFSVAIPLLAALMMVNWQETYRRRQARSGVVQVARALAYGAAYAGVVAGFWHMLPVAGIAILVFSVVGLAVHTSGYVRVERGDASEGEPAAGGGPESGS